jgi:hypothetical protein
MRCSRKDRMTGKQLYEANHLCMMNSNYRRKNLQEIYHLKILFIQSKTTSHIKNAEKVPNFAARWHSIRKYLILYESKRLRRTNKIQQQNENIHHTPIAK